MIRLSKSELTVYFIPPLPEPLTQKEDTHLALLGIIISIMTTPISFEIEMPKGWETVRLPDGVNRRLQELLDRQDAGTTLTNDEAGEAQGLVDLSEWLTLVRLRSERVVREMPSK